MVSTMLLATGAGWGLQGCDSPALTTTQRGTSAVRLSLATSVVAAPGAVVEAIVSFTPTGSTAITLVRDSVVTNTGGTDASLSLTADVAGCVRAAPAGGSCVLDLVVRLKRTGAVLDESTQRLTVGPATERIDAAAVQLFEVATLRVSGSATALLTLEPGDVTTLSAAALDRNGATVAGRAATWSVVSGGVTISASGVLQAVAPGAAVVRASMASRTQNFDVIVKQPSIDTLRLAPLDTTIVAGGSFAYRLRVASPYGVLLQNRVANVTSSNTTVATVTTIPSTQTYQVIALSPGLVTITASSTEGRGGATVTTSTTLRVLAPARLAVTPASLNFATALLTPLPPAQTVAVTSTGTGSVDPISVVTLDSVVVASLDRTVVPAVLTVRATTALAPGTSLQREVRIRSAVAGVPDAVVAVAVTGIQPPQGLLSGVINNSVSGAPIAGASIAIRRAVDNVLVTTAVTGTNGAWTSVALPAATYSLVATAQGFLSVTVLQVALAGGPNIPTTQVPAILMVPSGSGSGVISGAVRDATNNTAIAAATVELRSGANNVTGTVIASGPTSANGLYAFPPQPAGTYTVLAAKVGYVDNAVVVTVQGANVTAPTVFLSPAGNNVAWRFVLTWGATPQDLDAHLTGPIQNSQVRFHVYYPVQQRGSLVQSPFALLDIDVVTGLGPETITMSQEVAGTYRYYVDNFSQESPLRTSGALVKVYKGNALFAQYAPPPQDGSIWIVFEIANGTLTPVQTIGNTAPSLLTPDNGPRQRHDAATAALAEWYNLAPWDWVKAGRRR